MLVQAINGRFIVQTHDAEPRRNCEFSIFYIYTRVVWHDLEYTNKSEEIIVGEPVVTSVKTRVPQILYFTLVDYSYFSMIELVKR